MSNAFSRGGDAPALAEDEISALLEITSPSAPPTGKPSTAALRCAGCQADLGVGAPAAGAPLAAFACPGCDGVYLGRPLRNAEPGAAPQRKLSHDQIDRDSFCGTNASRIASAYEPLTGCSYAGAEQSNPVRHNVSLPVTLIPTDTHHRLFGAPTPATLRDVSIGGVCVLADEAPALPMGLLDFTAAGVEALQLLVQVQWTKEVGSFFEIGLRFVRSEAG